MSVLREIEAEVTARLCTPTIREEIVRRVLEGVVDDAWYLGLDNGKQLILRGKHPTYPELEEMRRQLTASRDAVQMLQSSLRYGRYDRNRIGFAERREFAEQYRRAIERRKQLKLAYRNKVKEILGPDAWGKGQA